jgi:hypothetical protein
MFSSLGSVLQQFNWTSLGFVYTTSTESAKGLSVCSYFANTFTTEGAASPNITDIYGRHIVNATLDAFKSALKSMIPRARSNDLIAL